MQGKDVRQNENLPLEGVVGAITKSEKKSHCMRKPICNVRIF